MVYFLLVSIECGLLLDVKWNWFTLVVSQSDMIYFLSVNVQLCTSMYNYVHCVSNIKINIYPIERKVFVSEAGIIKTLWVNHYHK